MARSYMGDYFGRSGDLQIVITLTEDDTYAFFTNVNGVVTQTGEATTDLDKLIGIANAMLKEYGESKRSA